MTQPIKRQRRQYLQSLAATAKSEIEHMHCTSTSNAINIEVLNAALSYAARGWRVLPVFAPGDGGCSCSTGRRCGSPGKHPRLSGWPQRATTNPSLISRWWKEHPGDSVGIATGQGIAVLDVDTGRGGDESLAELERQHSKLPETVLCLTGGGGRHYYFRSSGDVRSWKDELGSGVELKASGGFVVAPPSLHASGNHYEWELSSTPEMTPLAELPNWLIGGGLIEQGEQLEAISACSINRRSACSITLDEAIRETLPRGVGQRNQFLFRFLRILKAMPEFRDASIAAITVPGGPVDQWFDQAKPVVGTKDRDATLEDAAVAWPRIKSAAGESPAEAAMFAADSKPAPAVASRYDNPATHRLIKLCRELQTIHGTNEFFLSCHVAAKLLGLSDTAVWRKLKLLCEHGVIQLGEPGTTIKAARYRYLGD